MAQFHDTFSTIGALVNHPPDTGTSWVKVGASGADLFILGLTDVLLNARMSLFPTNYQISAVFEVNSAPTTEFWKADMDINQPSINGSGYVFHLRGANNSTSAINVTFINRNTLGAGDPVNSFIDIIVTYQNDDGNWREAGRVTNIPYLATLHSVAISIDLTQHKPGDTDEDGTPRDGVFVWYFGTRYHFTISDQTLDDGVGLFGIQLFESEFFTNVGSWVVDRDHRVWVDNVVVHDAPAVIRTSADLTTDWDLDSRKEISIDHFWGFGRRQQDLAPLWNVNRAEADLITIWDIDQRPSAELQMNWDSNPRFNAGIDMDWHTVPTRIEVSLVTDWNLECLPPLISASIDEGIPRRATISSGCGTFATT